MILLESFWPILAIGALSARIRDDFPMHFAMQHRVNRVQTERDGATLVYLGEPLDLLQSPSEDVWYPAGKRDPPARSRLFRRVLSDRWALETSLGIALAIRRTVYHDYDTCLTSQGKDLVVCDSLTSYILMLCWEPMLIVLVQDFGVCAGKRESLARIESISFSLVLENQEQILKITIGCTLRSPLAKQLLSTPISSLETSNLE